MGVPLIANRSVTKRGGLQPPILYANEQMAAVKRDRKLCGDPPLTKAELAPMRTFCAQFPTIDLAQRQHYIDKAKETRDARAVILDGASSEDSYDADTRFGLCSKDEAVRSEVIEQMFTDSAHAGNLGGMTKTASRLRDGLANFSVCHEKGDNGN